jgi:hypothetical protein
MQVAHGPAHLEAVPAQACCHAAPDGKRLLCHGLLLGRRQRVHGAHVVQPISQLDKDHQRLLNNGLQRTALSEQVQSVLER